MALFRQMLACEFSRSIRRRSLWIAYGLLFAFYAVALLLPSGEEAAASVQRIGLWAYAAQSTYRYNLFLPIVGGILTSDRLQRDVRLGVRELQRSAPLGLTAYILSKYLGVLLSVLAPVALWLMVDSAIQVAGSGLPAALFAPGTVTFLAITVPAYAFIVAFSLGCPLVMPIRVYQILFTGYWVWGNFLSPKAFPTLNGTIFTPGGVYAMQGFFLTDVSLDPLQYTAAEAWLNLLVLGLCIAGALWAIRGYLRWQAERA